jgi:stage V sporulation protein G
MIIPARKSVFRTTIPIEGQIVLFDQNKERMMSALKECDVISVRKLEGAGKLKAYMDIRIGGSLIVSGCTIMDGKKGVFASLPRQIGRDGKWRPVVFEADDHLREHYAKKMLDAYKEGAE